MIFIPLTSAKGSDSSEDFRFQHLESGHGFLTYRISATSDPKNNIFKNHDMVSILCFNAIVPGLFN